MCSFRLFLSGGRVLQTHRYTSRSVLAAHIDFRFTLKITAGRKCGDESGPKKKEPPRDEQTVHKRHRQYSRMFGLRMWQDARRSLMGSAAGTASAGNHVVCSKTVDQYSISHAGWIARTRRLKCHELTVG